ncbi:MAG TPA: hypothetical protein PJ982_13705 [Lacipirellulaceae bacterium]|nr:hypothetical protein [Lacipirellulaceae bacterium]
MAFRATISVLLAAGMLACAGGCSLIVPTTAHRPVIRNPFPQLSRVAIAPFFNQSDEPTLDGRQVAMAYFAELQATPGFEVVPLGVVEEAIIHYQIDLSGPNEARRLAKILDVDAVVVGAVTDFREYYPPRMGLRVEWYAANPGFHPIPAGYGLPWATPEEEFIPDSLVYESQMALARQQMAALSPDCEGACVTLPAPPESSPEGATPAQHVELVAPGVSAGGAAPSGAGDAFGTTGAIVNMSSACPSGACSTASAERPPCLPQHGPVLSHTRIYRGNDADFTEALEGYVFFRDDHRFGGWKSYLSRSDDFVRFCCHMHISEMLSARGGSRKTQVVWRWPESR